MKSENIKIKTKSIEEFNKKINELEKELEKKDMICAEIEIKIKYK